MSAKITFYLETDDPGRIPVNSLRSALNDITGLLGDVETEVAHSGRRHLSWDVTNIGFGSALIELEATPIEEDLELADSVVEATFSGLGIIAGQPVRPNHFTDEALEHAQRLTRLLGDGISGITISTEENIRPVHIREHLAGNVRQILEHTESYGSVEGVLEVLSSRGALHFSIRNVSTRKRVRCNFGEDLVNEALAAWRKRIVVFGRLRVDNQGNIRTVWAWNISVLRPSDELPGPEDVKGLLPNMREGLSSEEYTRDRYGQ